MAELLTIPSKLYKKVVVSKVLLQPYHNFENKESSLDRNICTIDRKTLSSCLQIQVTHVYRPFATVWMSWYDGMMVFDPATFQQYYL